MPHLDNTTEKYCFYRGSLLPVEKPLNYQHSLLCSQPAPMAALEVVGASTAQIRWVMASMLTQKRALEAVLREIAPKISL